MKKIINLLKTNKYLYLLYNLIFSNLIKFLGLFVRIDDNLILFNSYGGKKFDDSPKAIYDYMLTQKKYENFKFYWAFDFPEKYKIPRGFKIKNNSFNFFVTALKAKYWITNSGIERGLKFKKEKTILINTWHGTALKHIGLDENNLKVMFKTSKVNYFYAQSKYDVEIFSRAYNLNKNSIFLVGLPRNDELTEISDKEIKKIKRKVGIKTNKKIILYAPTFREYSRDANGCVIAPPINIDLWKKELHDKYIVLFRAHYEINKVMNIVTDKFIYNVTDYPNLNNLLKISDILISDYSSIMIDYSILGRPIYSYAYDYEEYKNKRGLYIDLRKELPNGICTNENELLSKIKQCDYDKERLKTTEFKNKFVEKNGNSRKFIDEIISKEENK